MSGVDDLALLVRVTGGLVVVLLLVAVVARLARRARGFSSGQHLRVVERVGLSREAYVAVVEAGGRSLLLGVTPQGVSMLAPLDVPAGHREPVHLVLETARSGADAARGEAARENAGAGERRAPTPGGTQGQLAAPRVAMPAGVDLTGHPDLASALRAAGRTAGEGGTPDSAGRAPAASPPAGLPRRAELRGGGGARRGAPVPRQRQASGSVLSPATWRQGIDALRELTVRRG